MLKVYLNGGFCGTTYTIPSFCFLKGDIIGIEADEFLETPVSDGTIEENFEEAFGLPSLIPEYPSLISVLGEHSKEVVDDFLDVAQHGIVDVVGDDTYGRKVIGWFLLLAVIEIVLLIIIFISYYFSCFCMQITE